MLFSPGDFFNLFFSELDRLSIPYVVLHSYEGLPHKIESDIDYAVLTRDLPRLAGIQRRLAESCGAVLAHTIEAHIHALYTVIIDPKNPASFLQLDACGHYVERDCRLLQDTEILEGRRKFKNFFVPAPEVEFSYLLAKALAKATPLAPRFPVLRELWRRFPTGAQTKFANLTGDGSSFDSWIDRPADDWTKLRNAMLSSHRPGLGDRLREISRAVRRVARPKGLHLSLLGMDSETRTNLRRQVGAILENAFFRRQFFFDFKNSGLAKDPASPQSINAPQSFIGWMWRFMKEYFRVVLPARIRNELVFSEGGIDNLLRDPDSYMVKTIGPLGRVLQRLVPRPDLTIVLVDSNAKARSPEPFDRRIAKYPNRYLDLRTVKGDLAQATAIIQRAFRLLCDREQS